MKRIWILWHIALLPLWGWGQTCGLGASELPIAYNARDTFPFDILNIANDDLSDPAQGVCGFEVAFFLWQPLEELEMWLESPSGQQVQLIGPHVNFIGFSPGTRVNIRFVPNAETPEPDPGFPARWDNTVPGGYPPMVYQGSYYPFSGRLEDFNTGTVNGTWRLITNIDPTSLLTESVLYDIRLTFCDPAGESCCYAEAGRLPQDDVMACESSGDLQLNLPPSFSIRDILPDTMDYAYTYAISESGILIAFDSVADLRTRPPGDYQICGLSYKKEEQGNFPIPDGLLTLDSLRNNLQDVMPFFCGELTDDCVNVTILAPPDTTKLSETICQGDSLFIANDTLMDPGLHYLQLNSVLGCDSIVEVDLTVLPITITNLVETLCTGDSLVVGPSVYRTSGIYSDTLQTVIGSCDSIINLDLTILPPLISNFADTICLGDSYMLGDSVFSQSGTYEVILSSVDGCDSTVILNLTILEVVAEIAVPEQLTCDQPSVELDGRSSGPEDLSFRWFDDTGNELGQDPTQSVSLAGDYILEVIRTSGTRMCTARDTVQVIENAVPPIANAGLEQTITCNQPIVTIGDLSSSQGTDYSHQWLSNDGNIIGDPTELQTQVDSSGTYQLIVTDLRNGCTDTSEVNVIADNLPPLVDAGPNQLLSCRETVAVLDGSGSDAGTEMDYQWTAIAGTLLNTPDPLRPQATEAGIYQLTVLNTSTGCLDSARTAVFSDTISPVISIDAPGELTCDITQLTLNSRASDAGNDPILQWVALDGTGLVSNSNSFNPTIDQTGDYRLIVTNNENGCQDSLDVSITSDLTPPLIVFAEPDTIRCEGMPVLLEHLPGADSTDLEVQWFDPQGQLLGTGFRQEVSEPGVYNLQLKNIQNGCLTDDSLEVFAQFVVPNITYDDLLKPCEQDTFSLKADIDLPEDGFDILWTGPGIVEGENELNLRIDQMGEYVLRLTDRTAGCVYRDTVVVMEAPCGPCLEASEPLILTCDQDQVQLEVQFCEDCVDCLISWTTADGLILSGDDSLLPIVGAGGTYTISVTDTFNITKTLDVIVEEDRQIPAVDAGADKTLTCQQNTVQLGTNNTDFGSDYALSWQIMNDTRVLGTDTVLSVGIAGTYIIKVENLKNGCIVQDSVEVIPDDQLPVVSAGMDTMLTCNLDTVRLSGNFTFSGSNFRIEWTADAAGRIEEGADTPMPLVSAAGIYTMTVFDEDNGCSASDAVVVAMNDQSPVIEAVTGGVLSCSNRFVPLAVSGADTLRFAYEWCLLDNNGDPLDCEPGYIRQADLPGNYRVEVTDLMNGCSSTTEIELKEDRTAPLVEAGPDQNLGCSGEGVLLAGSVEPPGGNYRFQWQSDQGQPIEGDSTLTPRVFEPGLYQLNVENLDNGCTATDSIRVSSAMNMLTVFVGPDTSINCHSPGIQLSSSTNSTDVDYLWSSPDANLPQSPNLSNIEITEAGTYILQITDRTNGCTATDTIFVMADFNLPEARLVQDVTSLVLSCGAESLELDASASTAAGGGELEYLWSGSSGSAGLQGDVNASNIGINVSGSYQLEVEDLANGCRDTLSFTVEADETLPQLSIAEPLILSCERSEIMLDASASDGVDQVSYQWFFFDQPLGDTSLQLTVDMPGIYRLEGRNRLNNCINEDYRNRKFGYCSSSDKHSSAFHPKL